MTIAIYAVDGSLALLTHDRTEAIAMIKTMPCKRILMRRSKEAIPLFIGGKG
jgi:hypothetical protein